MATLDSLAVSPGDTSLASVFRIEAFRGIWIANVLAGIAMGTVASPVAPPVAAGPPMAPVEETTLPSCSQQNSASGSPPTCTQVGGSPLGTVATARSAGTISSAAIMMPMAAVPSPRPCAIPADPSAPVDRRRRS